MLADGPNGRGSIPPDTPGHGTGPADEAGALRVQRALAELRGGRAVTMRPGAPSSPAPEGSSGPAGRAERSFPGGDPVRLAAIETLPEAALADFVGTDGRVRLLVAGERAEAIGCRPAAATAELVLDAARETPARTLGTLRTLAGLSATPWREPAGAAFECRDAPGSLAGAALALARESSLIPALLWRGRAAYADDAPASSELELFADDALAYPAARGRLLDRASSAMVPLAGAGRCEFTVFRERFGEAEHVAVTVGEPDRAAPVTVRIHSACFTGDIFGSMKCDCGEQLRGAVAKLARDGGGVILYLAQEGRGIGLANKLRAYSLQARGFDTIDADRTLGFRSDHRDFTVARTMLESLGIRRVRLVTNNPRKIAALDAGGIEVVERVPSIASINPHNVDYLETKRDRAGHLFGPNGLAVANE